jgi:hypothetical protein
MEITMGMRNSKDTVFVELPIRAAGVAHALVRAAFTLV